MIERRTQMHTPAETDAIVRDIMADMCDGRWRAGMSHRAYATKLGAEIKTVRHWAAQASRSIRLCAGNEDEIRGRMQAGIDHIISLALQQDPPDLHAYLGALTLLGKVHGIGTTQELKPQTTIDVTIEQAREALGLLGYEVVAKPTREIISEHTEID